MNWFEEMSDWLEQASRESDATVTIEKISFFWVPDDLLGETTDESEEGGFDLGIRFGMDWASDDAKWEALAGFMDSATKKKLVTITEESMALYFRAAERPELRDIVFMTPFTYGFIEGLKRNVALKGG